jgi:hypothetical protein
MILAILSEAKNLLVGCAPAGGGKILRFAQNDGLP